MSWAGKKRLGKNLRSLFTLKEQAPSVTTPLSRTPLLPHTVRRMEEMLRRWTEGKGFRMMDSSLEAAAARIGTDAATLNRYFWERGEDFRTYRTRLRVEDAKNMLVREPEVPAATVCRRAGFSDRSNFNRQFKAHTGLTPTAWRAQHLPTHDK